MFDVLSALLLAPLPFALILAAASDARRFIIPNWTSALCALGALPALALSGLGLEAIGLHAAVGAGALLFGFALFALGLWGGGDGKLFAAAALWFDPTSVLTFVIVVGLAGGVLGAAALALRWVELHATAQLGWSPASLSRWMTHAPYGVAIALGALIAFPETALYAAYLGSV